jgi:tRNA(fMet)-specific endonuclease VapC
MLRFLFDTDHLTLYEHGHLRLKQRLIAQPPGTVGVSAVTIFEALRGRLAAVRRHQSGPLHLRAYAKLVEMVQLLQQFPAVHYDQAAEVQFQQLHMLRLRIGTRDLKIAAIALANNLTLLTRNRRDFGRIPGLVLDDWSV